MDKKKYYLALQDKKSQMYNVNDKNNITKGSNPNKYLYFPISNVRSKSVFLSSETEFKQDKNKVNKLPKYLHRKATEYKLHPFRNPNLKIIGEFIKYKLLDKNQGMLENKNTKTTKNNSSSDTSELILSKRKSERRISNIVRNIKNEKKNERKSVKFDTNSKILKYRVLIRTRNLYDSIDDDESENDEIKGFSINPEQKIFILYDFLILAFFVYNFIFSTKSLCLEKTFCQIDNKFTYSDIILLINDILYIIDFILSFFRSYYNFEYKLIKSNRLILKHFFKYDFIFDLLSAIPIFLLSKYKCLTGNNNFQNYKYGTPNSILVLRLCSILKVFKIKKIINRHDKNQALDKLNELISKNYTIKKIVRIIMYSLIYLSILHCFVCIHIFLGKNSYSNWIIHTNSQNESFGVIYIKSLYFIITTLTTVGYGDIVCKSFYEVIYQIIILVIGSMLYPYIISSMGHSIKKVSHAKIHLENNLAMLETIRRDYPNIPFKLYNTIHKYLKRKSISYEKYNINSFIESLPFPFKNQILFTMYKKYIFDFKFFKRNNNSVFIAEVLNNFIPSSAKKNDFLIYEGELVEEIIFIKDGKISFNAAINTEEPLISLNKYFLERFTPFTNEEEDKLFKENLTNLSYFPKVGGDNSYDKTKLKLTTVFKNHASNIVDDINNDIHIRQIIKRNNYNFFDVKGDAIINDEGNYQYLKIVDIRKKEHFGCVFVTLNKPCPLSLQVKSKFAELFLLKKVTAVGLSRNYPNIWKKLYGREFLNMMKIKNKTFSILTKYIELNELLVNNNVKEIINANEINEITPDDISFLEKLKTTEKLPSIISQDENLRRHSINHKSDRKQKTIIIEDKIRKDLESKIEKKIKFKRNNSFSGFDEKFVNLIPAKRFSQTNSNFFNQESNIKNKKKTNKDKLKELKSFLKLSKKFFENYNDIKNVKDSPKKNSLKNEESNIKENTNEINKNDNKNKKIVFESDIDKNKNLNKIENSKQLLKDLEDICKEETNFSFCSMNKENNFNTNKLSIESNSHFEILSMYQNANEISKGKYIHDKKFQKKLKLIIKNHYLHKHKEPFRDYSLSLKTLAFSSGFESCNYISENKRRKIKKKEEEKYLKNENNINKMKNREKKFDNNLQRKKLTKIQTIKNIFKTYTNKNKNFCNDFPDLKLTNENLILLEKKEANNSNSIKVNKSKTSSSLKSGNEFREEPFGINIRKNINICNNKELEFIIDKGIDKNLSFENFLMNNNSNVNNNINSSIYDDKNNQILNQTLGIQLPNNIILENNIISRSPEKKDNFYNSFGKINNTDNTANTYNIIQKNFDNSNRKNYFCNLF